MTLVSIARMIVATIVEMIQTLTGDNSFAVKRELSKRIRKHVGDYGDLSVEQIDVSEADEMAVTEALTSLPFLTPQKLVVLRQPSANKVVAEKLPDIIEQVPETTDVVMVEEKIDKRSSLYKFLKSKTDFQEMSPLDQAQIIKWVEESARTRGANIKNSDARYLVDRVGLNQERLDNELSKLVLHSTDITKESIELLTEQNPSSSIFDLLETAFNGNSARVIKLYDEQRQLKVEPQQIISMLTWQLHILLVVKSAGDKSSDVIAREAGINPYVVRKSQILARGMALSRISSLVNGLLKLDIDSKSKSIDLDDALTHYLLSI